MSDHNDELKADLFAILNGGPGAITADEAIARARLDDRPHTGRLAVGHRRGPRLAAISFAVVIGLLVGYLVTGGHIGAGGPGSKANHPAEGPSIVAEPSYIRQATSVPESVYDTVGLPAEIVNHPKKVNGRKPLVPNGPPELLYVWASFCPFCAAENWALVMALSKFGTFSGLNSTHSSVSDFAPDTQTPSFASATYVSPYLTFKSYDLATNVRAAGKECNVDGYRCLQTAPQSTTGLFESLGQGAFPFMDFDNKVAQEGAGFEDEPLVLAGLSTTQIAASLSDPSGAVARAEVGSANYFIAAICAMSGGRPTAICSTPVIREAEIKEGFASETTTASKPVLGVPTYFHEVPPSTTAPDGTVTGRVWSCGGVITAANSEATAYVFLHGRLAAEDTVREGGQFEFLLPPGDYQITDVNSIGPNTVSPHDIVVRSGTNVSQHVTNMCF